VLDAAVEVADAFLDTGIIVTAEGRSKESQFRMDAAAGDLTHGVPNNFALGRVCRPCTFRSRAAVKQ
jgi:hypothetical protein